MNPKIDAFLKHSERWQKEIEALRLIALDCGLSEELKWGKPCYSDQQSNIAIIQPFKERCAFMFFKGALLKDPNGLLERPGQNSHAPRRMMFSNVDEVTRMGPRLRTFIAEAVELEKIGSRVHRRTEPSPIPDELADMYDNIPRLREAFDSLTSGRQRAYILHFTNAKQTKTRVSRIDKCIERILEGKGLTD